MSLPTEYEYDEKKQRNLQQFHKEFKDQLPMLVIVTEGSYGETKYDDFSNDQVIRLHRPCQQLRALGMLSRDGKRLRDEFLSIPVDGIYTFAVVKDSKTVGDAQSMDEILSENELPVQVRYANNNIELNSTLKSIIGVNILILKIYNEDYMQGNCMKDSVLSPGCTLVALSPNISVAAITGYTEKSMEAFQREIKSMDIFVEKNVKFQEHDGCPDLTMFERGDITTGTGNPVPPDLLPRDYSHGGDDDSPPPPLSPRPSIKNKDKFKEDEFAEDEDYEAPPIPQRPLKKGSRPSLPLRPDETLPSTDADHIYVEIIADESTTLPSASGGVYVNTNEVTFPESVLSPGCTLVALSPNISVAAITGYTEKSKEAFQRKFKSMEIFVEQNVKFKEHDGCPDLTMFERGDITTGTGNPVPPDLLPRDYSHGGDNDSPQPPLPHRSSIKNKDKFKEDEFAEDEQYEAPPIPQRPLKKGSRPSLPLRSDETLPSTDDDQIYDEVDAVESTTLPSASGYVYVNTNEVTSPESVLSPSCTLVALSPNISVAAITGNTEKSKEAFQREIKSMDIFVENNVKFQEHDDCPDLTMFERGAITTGTGNAVPPHLLPRDHSHGGDDDAPPPPRPHRPSIKNKDKFKEEEFAEDYEAPPIPDNNWTPQRPLKKGSRPSLPLRPDQTLPSTDNDPIYYVLEASESTTLPSASGGVYVSISEATSPESGYNSAKESKDSWSFGSTGSYVSNKSIQNIQDILKSLNLSKYCDVFQKHLIDGDLLEDLTEQALRNDFSFMYVEAVRLMKYVRTGHVPK